MFVKEILLSLFILPSLFLVTACDNEVTRPAGEILITAKNKWQGSTLAGNLITTAMKHELGLDVVFYPTALLDENKFSVLKVGMKPEEIDNLLDIYADEIDGVHDQFLIGSMSGREIKQLLFLQAESTYRSELHVAGLKYDFKFVGGLNTIANLTRKNQSTIIDDRKYKVAINNTFLFNGRTAPGYLFGFGLNFSFKRFSNDTVSAKKALKKYLTNMTELPLIEFPRTKVSTFAYGSSGFKKIYEIQGTKHLSSLRGFVTTTRGIVTATGFTDRYPGGYEIYIQDAVGDNNPYTSDAIYAYVKNTSLEIKKGQLIEITGVVYEDRFNSGSKISNGLTRTAIREVSDIKIISEKNILPQPVVLGIEGRKIPNHYISTYNANLNRKPKLNLDDGIDFWESLESMQIKINNPRVVGFSGGEDKLQDKGPKSLL